jgi:hypothetical protein
MSSIIEISESLHHYYGQVLQSSNDLKTSASWFAKIDCLLSLEDRTISYWEPMTGLGRYVKLYIATHKSPSR